MPRRAEDAETPEAAGKDAGVRRGPGFRLAVAGLILALIPCCPLTGLVGTLLGLLALRRAARAGAEGGASERGQRIALAAVLIGAASAVLWSSALGRFARSQEEAQAESMQAQVAAVVEGAIAGRPEDVREAWVEDAAPDDAAIRKLGETLSARYGRFERFAIISTTRPGLFRAPQVEVSGVLHFERAAPMASARFTAGVDSAAWSLRFRLSRLVIEDAANGRLELGGGD